MFGENDICKNKRYNIKNNSEEVGSPATHIPKQNMTKKKFYSVILNRQNSLSS